MIVIPTHGIIKNSIFQFMFLPVLVIGDFSILVFLNVVVSRPAVDNPFNILFEFTPLVFAPFILERSLIRSKNENIIHRAGLENLFPEEQARIVQLLVKQVNVYPDRAEVRIRAEGLDSLVAELQGERTEQEVAA